jgi:hypothetical protein
MDELDQRLKALARADAGAEAPARVEAHLKLRLARARRRRQLLGAGGVAAVAAAALWLLVPATTAPVLPAAPRPSTGALGGGFLPIAAHAPEIEHGQIVRMQVPAGLVVSFGWPFPAEDDHPRTADVLFGEDGVARAIRFVPASFRTGR